MPRMQPRIPIPDLFQDFSDGGGQLIGVRSGMEMMMLFKQLANDHAPAGHGAPQALFQTGIVPGGQQMHSQRLGLGPVTPMQEIEIIQPSLVNLRGLGSLRWQARGVRREPAQVGGQLPPALP